MGRIKRKKTSGSKKKKQQKAAAEESVQKQAVGQAGKNKTALAETGDTDAKKKQAVPQKKAQTTPGVTGGVAKPNFIDVAFQFLREVKVELKKVTWPSRKQTVGSTVVVLVLVLLISLFLGVVDIGLSSLIQIVLK
jgi:preprotein translocase subunit SecE